ncbi:MAG: response regulator [Isosphaeraceae bacterium]
MNEFDADGSGPGRKAVVLVVDDEPLGREVLETALRPLGCELLTAAGGTEALDRAEASLPDVVLLDVLMPGMDGIEVCRRIRSSGSSA